MLIANIISLLFILLIISAVIIILDDNCDSGRKVAWLLVITVLPVIGIILYLLVGINYRHHWYFKRKHQKTIDLFRTEADERLKDLLYGNSADSKVRPEYRNFVNLLGVREHTSVCDGNDFEIITDGHRKFELLMKDLKNARESIHMEYFLFGNDSGSRAVKELLMKKAREGVEVRFIHENIANITILPGYYNEMKNAGVQVVKFNNPRPHLLNLITSLNYRNHRKIVVVDGRIAYTGGMNISNKYFTKWRDTHLRITGNAVASLQYVFLDSWLTSGGGLDRKFIDYFPVAEAEPADKLMQVVADEPNLQWPVLQMSYEWVIHNSKKYFWIQTPYFVPPIGVMDALKSAALSGVDVRLMIPAKADAPHMGPANESFFTECLEAGIKIYQRGGEFIHSKTFVCDDYLSSIGTANMDYRSFNINYEVNTYIYDEATALQNRDIFLKDMELSTELRLADWHRRPWYKKLLERIMRLFAPLL